MFLKTRILLLLVLFTLCETIVYSQCNVSVTVPADITLCESETIDLTGTVSGPYIHTEWNGTNGFYNESISTSDTPTETTDYTFIAFTTTNNNLVVNGDFSQGNTGFTSDYLLADTWCVLNPWGTLGCEGMYTINNNASNTHVNFSPCTDHTSGSGDMMIVNGSPTGIDIWCQDIAVMPNTDYLFSAWATSVHPNSPAILQFSINGSLIGSDFGLSGATCSWENFTQLWTAGSNTNATICITNQNSDVAGNDFAIDDIEFLEVCRDSATMHVEFSLVEGEIPSSSSIDCDNPTANIEVTPSFLNYTYNWIAASGGIIDGPTNQSSIQASNSGLYQVTIIDENGCSKQLISSVTGNLNPPETDIVGDFVLSCDNYEVTVFATNNDSANSYEWPGSINNSTLGYASFDTPGNYYLQITNASNCIALFPFNISSNIIAPEYELPPPDILACIGDFTEISIDITDQPDQISWTNSDGDIISNSNNAIVTDIGYYTVEFTFDNGCSFIDSVLVESEVSEFNYFLDESPILTCDLDTGILEIMLFDAYAGVQWIHNNELYNGTSIDIDEPGLYVVEITDINGCVTRDSSIVNQDIDLPQFSLDKTDIDCENGQGIIELSSTDNVEVTWEFPNGVINDNLTINSGLPGTYYLWVKNDNGCTIFDSIQLEANQDYPILSFQYDSINCVKNEVSILSSSSLDGTDFEWTGPNNFSSSQDSFSVDIPGIYLVTATSPSGCVVNDSVSIPIDTIAPFISLTSDTINCETQQVNIEFINPENYIINSVNGPGVINFNNNFATVNNGGTYQVEIIGENGCESMIQAEITTDTLSPALSYSVDTITCKSNTAEILFNNPLSHTINLVSGEDVISFDQFKAIVGGPGIYEIEIEGDNGCNTYYNAVIPIDTVSPAIPNLPQILLDCNHTDSLLTISDIPGHTTFLTHGLDTTFSGPYLIDTTNGSFHLNVIETANGCSSEKEIPITYDFNAPQFELQATDITCKDSISLIFGNISEPYNLMTSYDNLPKSNDNQFMTKDPGLYSFVVQYNNGCEYESDILVTESKNYPDISTIDYTLGCDDTPVSLSVYINDPQVTFEWDGPENINGTDAVLSTLLTGTYYVNVTDNLTGCSSLDSLQVFPYVNTLDFDMDINHPLCFGEPGFVELTNVTGENAPYNVSVYDVNNEYQNSSQLIAGDYYLEIMDSQGCDSVTTFTLSDPNPIDIELDSEITISFGDEGRLKSSSNIPQNEIAEIIWEPSYNLSCTNCENPEISGLSENTSYTVTYINNNGCNVSGTIFVRVLKEFAIYTPNIFSPNNDGINDIFYLQTNDFGENSILETLAIYDRWGNLVYEVKNGVLNDPDYGWDGKFNNSLATGGVYVYYASIILPDQSVEILKGDITILR